MFLPCPKTELIELIADYLVYIFTIKREIPVTKLGDQ